jgi:hypothetical protein
LRPLEAERELFRGGLEHAESLRDDLLADAVAGDDGDAM